MRGFMRAVSSISGLVDLEVWRNTGKTKYDRWGDIDPDLEDVPIPALAGKKKVATFKNCVFEPRTTRINNRDAGVDGTTTTAITVYLQDINADVREGDYFVTSPANGVMEAWKLDGEATTNNYVSPFTGIIGGRELFLTRVKGMK